MNSTWDQLKSCGKPGCQCAKGWFINRRCNDVRGHQITRVTVVQWTHHASTSLFVRMVQSGRQRKDLLTFDVLRLWLKRVWLLIYGIKSCVQNWHENAQTAQFVPTNNSCRIITLRSYSQGSQLRSYNYRRHISFRNTASRWKACVGSSRIRTKTGKNSNRNQE